MSQYTRDELDHEARRAYFGVTGEDATDEDLAAIRDDTERDQAQQELARLRAELEDLINALQFLAPLEHAKANNLAIDRLRRILDPA